MELQPGGGGAGGDQCSGPAENRIPQALRATSAKLRASAKGQMVFGAF